MKNITILILLITLSLLYSFCRGQQQETQRSPEYRDEIKLLFKNDLTPDPVENICSDHHNKLCASLSGGQVIVWETSNGKKVCALRFDSGIRIEQFAFSHSGIYIATIGSILMNEPGSPHGNFYQDSVNFALWNAADGKLINKYTFNQYESFSNIDFTLDDKNILLNNRGKIQTFDFQTEKLLNENHHDASFGWFSPQSTYSIVYKNDRANNISLAVWNIQKDSLVFNLTTEININKTFSMPDMSKVVSMSYDERILTLLDIEYTTLKIWEMKTGKQVKIIPIHVSQLYTGCISPNGKYYATGSEKGEINIVELSSGNIIQTYKDYSYNIYCILWSPDEKLIYAGYRNGTIIALRIIQ